MWVGGPPNPMQPIRPHSRAMVARLTRSVGGGLRGSRHAMRTEVTET
jgi:hypothetical protein